VTGILQPIGRTFLNGLGAMGRLNLFALQSLLHCVRPPFYPRLILKQMIEIGYYSLPYVGMTAIFTGMVLALQTYTGFNVGAETAMPKVVVISLTRELGPVLAALIVAGRIGAAMAAEIGTMVVNEEVDALRVMSINPVRFLVLPRITALIIAMPLLTAIADFVGLAGGSIVSSQMFGVTIEKFKEGALEFLTGPDFWYGIFKSTIFACIIGTVACDRGMNTQDGAEGVGRATTETVVLSVVMVLVADFVLTAFINHILAPIFVGNG